MYKSKFEYKNRNEHEIDEKISKYNELFELNENSEKNKEINNIKYKETKEIETTEKETKKKETKKKDIKSKKTKNIDNDEKIISTALNIFNKILLTNYYKCDCKFVEEWKRYSDKYIISNKGKVISTCYTLPKVLSPENGTGYKRFVIGSKDKIYGHVFVAQLFIGDKPDDMECIDHIDGNKSHNCVTNLRYLTSSGNALNRKQTTYDRGNHISQFSKDYIFMKTFKSMRQAYQDINPNFKEWKFTNDIKKVKNKDILYLDSYWRDDTDNIKLKNDEKEEWKDVIINNKKITVSNMGRFEWKNGKISIGNKKENCKYLDYNDIRAHIIVATAFVEKKSNNLTEVNHINGNTQDNRAINLEWISGSNNSHHAVTLLTNKTKKAIKQIDPETGIVLNIFESVRCAHEYITKKLNINISAGAIEYHGQKNSTKHNLKLDKYSKGKSHNFIWKYVKDCKENEFKENIDNKIHKSNINQYDETRCVSMIDKNRLVHIFKNIKEAVNFMDVRIGKLRESLNGKRRTAEGFEWKWIEKSDYNKELYIDLCKQQLKSEKYKIKKNKTVICADMTNDKTFEFDIKAEKDDEFYILCVSIFKINEYKQFIYDIFKNLEFNNKKKHHIYIYYYDKDKYVSNELYI